MSSSGENNNIDLDSADRPFDNIINFRDVGKSINSLMGRKVLKEGVLFRSARLDDASERDKRRLLDEFHISTVIDLRSVTEHRMATQKRRAEQNLNNTDEDTRAQAEAEADADADADAEQAALMLNVDDHLVALPGVRRALISLTGKAWERSLLWRLDWVNFFKVLGLLTAGYRTDAVRIVGQHVMAPRGLIGLGQDTLDYSTLEMKQVFDILADSEHDYSKSDNNKGSDDDKEINGDGGDDAKTSSAYPLLLHCTQGKDRTGIIILLVLLLTNSVSEDAISTDYTRSEPELVVEAEDRLKEIRALGIPEEYIKCPDGFTGAIRAYLEERYGGVRGYLGSVGVGEEMQERIREVLVA